MRVASAGGMLIGAGVGVALGAGLMYLYRVYARSVPRLNDELERALKDPRYGFRWGDGDGDYALSYSTTAAKWWWLFAVVAMALIATGVVLLLL